MIGCTPHDWKMMYVSSILEIRASKKAESYTLISLTSFAFKLMDVRSAHNCYLTFVNTTEGVTEG